jgi:hypothetical protein
VARSAQAIAHSHVIDGNALVVQGSDRCEDVWMFLVLEVLGAQVIETSPHSLFLQQHGSLGVPVRWCSSSHGRTPLPLLSFCVPVPQCAATVSPGAISLFIGFCPPCRRRANALRICSELFFAVCSPPSRELQFRNVHYTELVFFSDLARILRALDRVGGHKAVWASACRAGQEALCLQAVAAKGQGALKPET